MKSHLGSALGAGIVFWASLGHAQDVPNPNQPPHTYYPEDDPTFKPEPPPKPQTDEPPTTTPPAPPSEGKPARFGGRGQIVLTGATSIGLTSTSYSHGDAGSFSVAVSPGIDIFVRCNFSVGIDLSVGYSDAKGYGADGSFVDTKSTTYGVGGRLGLNLPLGDAFSWYLRATLGFGATNAKVTLVNGGTASTPQTSPTNELDSHGAYINLYAPLLAHVAPHLFVGFGPYLYQDLTRTYDQLSYQILRTTVGASFVVGGWL